MQHTHTSFSEEIRLTVTRSSGHLDLGSKLKNSLDNYHTCLYLLYWALKADRMLQYRSKAEGQIVHIVAIFMGIMEGSILSDINYASILYKIGKPAIEPIKIALRHSRAAYI